MSCYIANAYSDRVEVLVDSAIWNAATYDLRGITSKAIQVGTLPLVITGRGDVALLMGLAAKLIELSVDAISVDATLTAFRDYAAQQRAAGVVLDVGNDFAIAGWSEKAGPRLWHMVVSDPENALGAPLWELQDVPSGQALICTTFTEAQFDEAGFYWDEFRYSVARRGVDLLRAVRRSPPDRAGQVVVPVGGTLLLVTVTQGKVDISPLGAWPDVLGLPLDPNAEFVPVRSNRPPPPLWPNTHRPSANLTSVASLR